jgi:CelD/BcsL family acetyltransferase involved in cellulose biosynthesis
VRTALIDPVRDPAWARLVARSAGAEVFHGPLWLGLLRDVYRYPIAAAVALDAAGEPVAGLPLAAVTSRVGGRRLVCVPFADACGLLVAPGAGDDAATAALGLAEAERRRRGAGLEIRGRVPSAGTPVDLFHRHTIDLRDGLEAAQARFRKSVRKNIRTAERGGVHVDRRTDPAALDDFYALHLRTRHRLGVPTQPRRFIRGLGRFLERDQGFVSVARHEGRTVAAAVFLRAGDTLVIKFSASDAEALALRPNNAIVADALRWAAGEGLAGLDYGRTDLGQEELRRYKRSWGAEEETVAYTYAGMEPKSPGHGRLDTAVGEVISRTPPVVGRLVGELLYRQAG